MWFIVLAPTRIKGVRAYVSACVAIDGTRVACLLTSPQRFYKMVIVNKEKTDCSTGFLTVAFAPIVSLMGSHLWELEINSAVSKMLSTVIFSVSVLAYEVMIWLLLSSSVWKKMCSDSRKERRSFSRDTLICCWRKRPYSQNSEARFTFCHICWFPYSARLELMFIFIDRCLHCLWFLVVYFKWYWSYTFCVKD